MRWEQLAGSGPGDAGRAGTPVLTPDAGIAQRSRASLREMTRARSSTPTRGALSHTHGPRLHTPGSGESPHRGRGDLVAGLALPPNMMRWDDQQVHWVPRSAVFAVGDEAAPCRSSERRLGAPSLTRFPLPRPVRERAHEEVSLGLSWERGSVGKVQVSERRARSRDSCDAETRRRRLDNTAAIEHLTAARSKVFQGVRELTARANREEDRGAGYQNTVPCGGCQSTTTSIMQLIMPCGRNIHLCCPCAKMLMEFKTIRDGDGERERNAGSKAAAAIAAHRVAVDQSKPKSRENRRERAVLHVLEQKSGSDTFGFDAIAPTVRPIATASGHTPFSTVPVFAIEDRDQERLADNHESVGGVPMRSQSPAQAMLMSSRNHADPDLGCPTAPVSTKEAGKAGLKRSSSSSSVELAVSSSQGPTVVNSASSACDDGSTVLGTVAQFQTPFQRRETASLRSSKLSAFSPDPAGMLAAGRSKDLRPRSREFVKDMVGPLVSKTKIAGNSGENAMLDIGGKSAAVKCEVSGQDKARSTGFKGNRADQHEARLSRATTFESARLQSDLCDLPPSFMESERDGEEPGIGGQNCFSGETISTLAQTPAVAGYVRGAGATGGKGTGAKLMGKRALPALTRAEERAQRHLGHTSGIPSGREKEGTRSSSSLGVLQAAAELLQQSCVPDTQGAKAGNSRSFSSHSPHTQQKVVKVAGTQNISGKGAAKVRDSPAPASVGSAVSSLHVRLSSR